MLLFLSGYVTDYDASGVCVNGLLKLYSKFNFYIKELNGRIISHVADVTKKL